MKEIPDRLWNAVVEIAKMQYPSVAAILRRCGFGYEAGKLDELIAAYQQATERREEKQNGKRNARRPR